MYSTNRNFHATLLQSSALRRDRKAARICRCVGWILRRRNRALGQRCGVRHCDSYAAVSNITGHHRRSRRSRQKQCLSSLLGAQCFSVVEESLRHHKNGRETDDSYQRVRHPRYSGGSLPLETCTLSRLCISQNWVYKYN